MQYTILSGIYHKVVLQKIKVEINTVISYATWYKYNIKYKKRGKMSESIKVEVERNLIKKYRRYLWSPFIRALKEFKLINEGDRVAVAISGGKDSLVLAKLVQELKKHGEVFFEAKYISMNPGFNKENKDNLLRNCEKMGIPVEMFDTDIFKSVSEMSAEYPCYMCARMRRGALYGKAESLGCNKLALGHHLNDVNETTLMNLLYTGCFKTMLPKLKSQHFKNMEIIRPMYYIYEKDIVNFMNFHSLKAMNCGCKVASGDIVSKRAEVKNLISILSENNPNLEKCLLKSVKNINLDCCLGWKYKEKKYNYLDDYES